MAIQWALKQNKILPFNFSSIVYCIISGKDNIASLPDLWVWYYLTQVSRRGDSGSLWIEHQSYWEHFRPMPTSTQTKSFNQTSGVVFLHSCQGSYHHCLTTLTQIFFPSPGPGDVNITGNNPEVAVTGRHGHHGFVAAEEQMGRRELILFEPQDSDALVMGNTFVLRYTDWTVQWF